MSKKYWVYILACDNQSYYTGYTNNLIKRFASHVNNTGRCKYTRSFKPLYIAQCWFILDNKSAALKFEKMIKRLPRLEKEKLIRQPLFHFEGMTLKAEFTEQFCPLI